MPTFNPSVDQSSNPFNQVDLSGFLEVPEKSKYKFLYIGSNKEIIHELSQSFHSGYTVNSLSGAQHLINNHLIIEEGFVDIIFIDLLVSKSEFQKFSSFYKKTALFYTSPIIYNKQLLSTKQSMIKQLEIIESSNIVDDIMDIRYNLSFLPRKIAFLRKSKRQQAKITRISNGHNFGYRHNPVSIKRIFDIILSSLAIILLAPIFILVAIAIRLESKGPVFYTSLRAGRGYKVFKFYKFRSMVPDADKKINTLSHLNQYDTNEKGPKFFKINNDPRVTKLGKFLRNSSIDELPQLFNVLKGDMSLVGNRPLPLYEAETLTTNEYVERFVAPAGITGLWQIKKRGKADMSTEERINLDITYAQKHSLFYDFKIIASTPVALLQKTNV